MWRSEGFRFHEDVPVVGPTMFEEADIDQYVDRIEASGLLGKSKRRLRLLSHLIRAEVLGEGENLKAYSIGLDVFGKGDDFDPSSDSIVRVEMGRLRNALTLFEASEFADTALKVEIPVGTYRPLVSRRETAPVEDAPPRKKAPKPSRMKLGAALVGLVASLALFFVYLTSSTTAERPPIGVQIADVANDGSDELRVRAALIQALSRSRAITVFDPDDGIHARASFLVSSEIVPASRSDRLEITVRDLIQDRVIWAKAFDVAADADISRVIEEGIARELRVRLYGASKDNLAELSEKELSPEALFVLATWVPGPAQSAIVWEKQRIELAQKALALDPDFGAAHSVLADKLGYLSNVYAPFDTAENRRQALFHARQALDLSPLDPDVVFNVAQAQWHSGLIRESRETMSRVTELDPSHHLSRFLTTVIPYTCSSAPDDVVQRARAFDESLSPDNPIRWLTLTWIGWLHAYREEWNEALEAEEKAARIFQIPYTYMRRAMILNQLGRSDAAETVIKDQSEKWEGFDPGHYAAATIPRLCQESPDGEKYISFYKDLVDAIAR